MKPRLQIIRWAAAVLVLAGLELPVQAAVGVVRFTAQAAGSNIMVEWETAVELYTAGFYLQGGPAPEGDFIRLSGFIPARGAGLLGAVYHFEDKDVAAGTAYYYVLEVVAVDQSSDVFGPISATVALPPSPTPTGTPTPANTATPSPAPLTATPTLSPPIPTATPSHPAAPSPPGTATLELGPSPSVAPLNTAASATAERPGPGLHKFTPARRATAGHASPTAAPTASARDASSTNRNDEADTASTSHRAGGKGDLQQLGHPSTSLRSPVDARRGGAQDAVAAGRAACVLLAGAAVLIAAACAVWAWLAADLARALLPGPRRR